MLLKYVHTKFEGCLNSYEIGNLICVIILHLEVPQGKKSKGLFSFTDYYLPRKLAELRMKKD